MEPTILLNSGRTFNLLLPDSNSVLIEDIAHGLSQLCRFTGQTRCFYSVAQHSVLVSRIVPPSDALTGLLHDAAEAYLGDVSSPLKSLLPDYRAIEKRIEADIFAKLDLPLPMPKSVKRADLILLATEQRDLMPRLPGRQWSCLQGIDPLAAPIVAWPPEQAREIFLERFNELQEQFTERHQVESGPWTARISECSQP